MTISRRLRYEILRRDNHACTYCGSTAPGVPLTVDHVTPVALGGSDEPANLATACRDCNSGKSSSSPDAPIVESVSQDAIRWAAAMRESMARISRDLEAKADYVSLFTDAWDRWHYSDGRPIPMPANWASSVGRWYAMQVPLEFIEDAVTTAMGKQGLHGEHAEFRYMAGVIWGRLNEAQTTTCAVLASGESSTSDHCTYSDCLECQNNFGLPIIITRSLSKVIDAGGREWRKSFDEVPF